MTRQVPRRSLICCQRGSRSFLVRVPARPPLQGLKRSLDKQRSDVTRKVRDGFIRETFMLPRTQARDKAREWFDRWPKQAYWTEIESWCERPDDVIEFTIRRLPTAD
ncbi:hypothetical protein [Mesorhizobium sp. CAU 1732]|uniref:hypothetical protein n=1 Tax=Mesorhizobium sp. CAU 1732 TaxID=3140358 RepID=UPI003261001D